MTNLTVVSVTNLGITFSNGWVLSSDHYQDCCEEHYLDFSDLNVGDFNGLVFDLVGESWFRRVAEYGIRLVAVNGMSVGIPGYGSNNGYYSDNLGLVVTDRSGSIIMNFEISECQEICWC